jgi:hypothetical protein
LESKARAEELIRKNSELAEHRKRVTRDAKIKKKDKIVALLQNSKMGGGSSQNILKLISSMEDYVRKSTNEENGGLFLFHSFSHALHNCKQVTQNRLVL